VVGAGKSRCYHPSTMSDASGTPASRQAAGTPPGLRDQLGSTFAAGKRLIRAHVDLGKAEASEIVDEVKRMVALIGVAIAVVLLAGMLFWIGGILFLGEVLFGSIGWGVLLGTLLLLDLAAIAVLLALDVKGSRIGTSFGIAAVIGIAVGLVLAFDLPHRGWEALGAAVAPTIDPAERTRNLAVGVMAGIFAILGLVAALRSSGGIGGKVTIIIILALLGAAIGWLTSATVAVQVGAALGVLVALLAWPVLAGMDLRSKGIDGEALKNKFMPSESIELGKETIEWVRARTPLAPKS
jgi:hypothetical protein